MYEQIDVQSVEQLDKIAEQHTLLQELRELDKSRIDETTCPSGRTFKVKFVAGPTDPDVGRLEVVDKRRADNIEGN